MGVKPDGWIRRMAEKGMIKPFSERMDGPHIASYGLQPAGYDARLAPEIDIIDWARAQGKALDPLGPKNPDIYEERVIEGVFAVPPHGCVIGKTLERFHLPRNCTVRGVGKTTYLSKGLNILASIQPGWQGRLLLHISNNTPVPILIYANQGIVYLEFHEVDGAVERDYSELLHPRFQERRS